jgi:predicted GNAT family N-acyltransferase
LEFQLRPIDADDKCRSLSLGDDAFTPLKTFLAREAKKLHRENLAKTFVMVEEAENGCRVHAYITLLCTHVSVQSFSEPLAVDGGFRYTDYPAVKLARLAVSKDLQGNNIGGTLVDFAIGLAVEHVMPHAGCRFLVLDAKEKSVGFYEKKGFTKMGTVVDGDAKHTAMFIDLHRLNHFG